MKPAIRFSSRHSITVFILYAAIVLTQMQSYAQPVWHCSRNKHAGSTDLASDQGSGVPAVFELSSANDTLVLALPDLHSAYSGHPVKIDNKPLAACFLNNGNLVHVQAMQQIGVNPAVPASLAKKTAIVNSYLFAVNDEAGMLLCIDRHYPAIGYLPKPTQTDEVAPCF